MHRRPPARPSPHRPPRQTARDTAPRQAAAQHAGPPRLLLHVVPGLEVVTEDEVAERFPAAALVGAWERFDERTSLLEYRLPDDPCAALHLATVEDVFLLAARARGLRSDAAGLSELAAAVLTAKELERALRAFAACRGRMPRTFRVVARRAGSHAYRRVDAQRAVEHALRTRLPALRLVEDDADAEFWLTLIGHVALLGLRLSTARLRGRDAEAVSLPAALKPTIARAMVRLSAPRPDDRVLDPFCGSGTLLVERGRAAPFAQLLGGDRDSEAVAATRHNLAQAGLAAEIRQWDALELPLPDASVDVVLTNPPFGKQLAIAGGDPLAFYRAFFAELRRVLAPRGWLVLITAQPDAVARAAHDRFPALRLKRRLPLLVRGEPATIIVGGPNAR